MKFFTKFDRPESPVVDFKGEPSLVAVEFLQECDINFLLARYKNTGSFYSVEDMVKAKRRPQFGDFTGIPDYHESLNKMSKALEMFEQLPLKVRQRFHDSPIELLAFLQDENNRAEAETLGIIAKTVQTSEPPPVTSEVTKNEEPKE